VVSNGVLGAARILQALARDNIFPIAFFGVGSVKVIYSDSIRHLLKHYRVMSREEECYYAGELCR